tara:strand:+ start:4518 stop:4958 length:441 start_codon:yes stop_codon:yes gene_type:complete
LSYKQPFKERNKSNIGEEQCEKYLESKGVTYTRYGFDCLFDVHWKKFMLIPEFLRCTPDYMVMTDDKAMLLEAKYCGEILRLKVDDMRQYGKWNDIVDVFFFIYSSTKRTHKILNYKKLINLASMCEIDRYEDNNKPYYKINFEDI